MQTPAQPAPSSATETEPFASITRDDLRAHIAAAGYQTIEDLAFADMNARKMMGYDKNEIVRIPREGAIDADTRARLGKAMGVPENEAGYGQFQPETGALGLSASEMSAFDKAMFGAGAPAAARNEALKFYHAATASRDQAVDAAYQAQVNEGLAALKGEWGADYDRRLSDGEAAAKQVLGDEFMTLVKDIRIDDHPILKRGFFKLAQAVAEDGRIASPPAPSTRLTPDQAQRKINEMMADPGQSKALTDPSHPDHKAALAQWQAWNDDLAAGAA